MIDENRPRVVHPDGMRSARPPAQGGVQAAAACRSCAEGDVQLSADVRRGNPGDASGLSPARLAEIRQMIGDGAYDTADVLQAVARRLLASGDLRAGS